MATSRRPNKPHVIAAKVRAATPIAAPGASPVLSASTPPATSLARVDTRLVDEAVTQLRKIIVAGHVETMAAAGEYLIERFYGSIGNARSHSPDKAASLARLSERAVEFGMTPATVRYVVPMALAVRELGAPLAGKLGITRLRALLPLKDSAQRNLVAEAAVSAGWTVDKVRVRVRKIQKPHAGGRRELPGVERAVIRIARVVEAEVTTEQLGESQRELPAELAAHLLTRVNHIQAQLARVEKVLERVVAKAARAPAE